MFVRKVSVSLKPGSLKDFVHLMHSEILPWLREQEGFQDLITLAGSDGCEVATLTFWDHELNAQACDTYPEGLQGLEDLLDGVPYVKTFHVAGSTVPRWSGQQRQTRVVGQGDTAQHAGLGIS